MSIDGNNGELVVYVGEDGKPRIDVRFQGDTVQLTQHIKNIFAEGELEEPTVVKDFFTTAADGKDYRVMYYNLDLIISLGYRVKSQIATKFRMWATQNLRVYIVKGFAVDDQRLKENAGGGYWKELLGRIRDIRSREKILYRQAWWVSCRHSPRTARA